MRRGDTSTGGRRAAARAAAAVHEPAVQLQASGLVVGIGASAGGLSSFEEFFRAMPPDSGAAFVLVQHLDPTHTSLTADLLARRTRMPVLQVERDVRVKPNHVYVIPPNRYLSIRQGTLHLSLPSEPRGLRMPIDLFLRSLAADAQEKAVGIILSGTGTDGSLGVKEIKAAGGMTMAQTPETAQHDGMPRSAIATGGIDYVLPVDRMPKALLQYAHHAYVSEAPAAPARAEPVDDLNAIIVLLRARTGFDFGPYKKGTLARRIQRRMSLRHVAARADYLRVLRADADEVKALSKDLLISVTSFFRDREAWDFLQRDVVPRIVERTAPGQPVRIWVPACASGEEAYSLGMLFIEQIQAVRKHCSLQIFASDVDREALEVARAGRYPESIALDVSPSRLARFFRREEHAYHVNNELRESVVFAQHNLIEDPPFSRLDLVSCRNLLVYLESGVQTKVIDALHFALLQGGYLFLGAAETIGREEDLFAPVSKKWRVYRRIGAGHQHKLALPEALASKLNLPPGPAARPTPGRIAGLVHEFLIDRYVPACVVINRKGEMLHFAGPTQDYLVQPPGPPTRDIFAHARDVVQTKLRVVMHRAMREGGRVSLTAGPIQRGETRSRVKISAEPLQIPGEANGLFLVSFEDEPHSPRAAAPSTGEAAAAEQSLVHDLESELKTTREDLRSTIEQLETANEALQASNEELMSANEELQSANEELQTSKEELQSLNEELSTINAQLQGKVDELERANNDLDNLLASTNLATIFLDREFRIARFTPAATRLFNLIPSDAGRPLSDISQKFTDPDLLRDAEAVLQKLSPVRKEVRTHEGRWYMREAVPYRTRDNRIEGVVITFSDAAEEVLQEARLRAEAIVDTVHDALLVLDSSLRVISANRAFFDTFQTSPEETANRSLLELGDAEWNMPALRTALAAVLHDGRPFADLEIHREFERIGERTMLLRARPLGPTGTHPDLMLLAIADVTERKRQEEALREREGRLRAIVDAAVDGIITFDAGGTITSFNPAAERSFGYRAAEVMGQNVGLLMPAAPGGEHDVQTTVARIIGKSQELAGRRKDDTTFPIELAVGRYENGKGTRFVGIVRDITQRVQIEEQMRRHEAELARVLRVGLVGELAASLAHELSQPLAAIANTLEACVARLPAGDPKAKALGQLLKHATAQSVQAGRIVHNVRELVRRRPARKERLELRQLISNAVGLISREVEQHRIVLRLELGDKPLPVRVRPIEIEQVLLNLLRNAIESIRVAGRKRRELVVQASGTAGTVHVAVRDTGTGIPATVVHQMFEPFFTTKTDGLGMGLAICRSIIEGHGGRLWVAPGERSRGGATVRFTLPLDRTGVRPTRGSRGSR